MKGLKCGITLISLKCYINHLKFITNYKLLNRPFAASHVVFVSRTRSTEWKELNNKSKDTSCAGHAARTETIRIA
jgi:hypothetical protein